MAGTGTSLRLKHLMRALGMVIVSASHFKYNDLEIHLFICATRSIYNDFGTHLFIGSKSSEMAYFVFCETRKNAAAAVGVAGWALPEKQIIAERERERERGLLSCSPGPPTMWSHSNNPQ